MDELRTMDLAVKAAGKPSAARGKGFKKTSTPEEMIPMNDDYGKR